MSIAKNGQPLLRRLWTEDAVTHHGERFHVDDARVNPKPFHEPLEVWMGGAAPLELRRVGRYSDGWLPSFCTVDDVREGIDVVQGHAAEVGRGIDPEHFGVLIPHTDSDPDGDGVSARFAEAVKRRHPDSKVSDVIATRDNLAERLVAFTEVGASKFVVVLANEPEDWSAELHVIAERVLPLEN